MTLAQLKAYYIDLCEGLAECVRKRDFWRGQIFARLKRKTQQKIKRIEDRILRHGLTRTNLDTDFTDYTD